jgi:hypothetical protein
MQVKTNNEGAMIMRSIRLRYLLGCAALFFATAGFALDPYYNVTLSGSTAIVKNAGGTQVYSSTDHQAAIQWAINNLPSGRTTKAKVKMTGTFTVDDTILLKSYLVFELSGTIKLANGVNKDLVHTATIEAGETDIEMIGGTYDANRNNQSKSTGGYYCILLKHARNSIFRDFTAQNCGQDGFILDTRCRNNTCINLLGRTTGLPETGISNGNGMGDRGDGNTWTDCVTDDTYSDGFVFKCRNSVWRRCLAKNGDTGAGFGLFCDDLICSNKVYDCEVRNFKGRAFSLRKPSDTSKGDDPIRNNYFEVYIHDTGVASSSDDQVGFRLWCSRNAINGKELIRDNQVHLLVRNTYDQGFYIKESHVSGTTGTIVCYSNHPDAIIEGHDNNLTFLVPDINKDTITKKGVNNTVNIRTISRSDTNTSWAARKYYQLIDGGTPPPPPPQASCHIDVPTGNVTVSPGASLLVKVSASDSDGIERVKLFNGATELMSDSSAPYELTLTNLTASFTLTAKVKDVLGNYTDSDNSRTITVSGGTATTVTFYSVGVHDGYVDESSETSNVGGTNTSTLTTGTALRVGDTGARKQRKSIVSFDTSTLPDAAVVTAATLRLKRGGGIGTPTSLGSLTVDIKNASAGFGTSLNLENADFAAAATASAVATLSYPATTNAWSTGNLNSSGLSAINKTGHTQLRVRFATDDDNDTADDYLGFYSGENASSTNRPILEVTYQ